jgi:hypothetical protein
MMICVAVECAFSSAGVPPAGLHCEQRHKSTGGTLALPRPRPRFLLSCVVTTEQTIVRMQARPRPLFLKTTSDLLALHVKKLRPDARTNGRSRRRSNAYISFQNRTDMGHSVQSYCSCSEDWVHACPHWVSRAL